MVKTAWGVQGGIILKVVSSESLDIFRKNSQGRSWSQKNTLKLPTQPSVFLLRVHFEEGIEGVGPFLRLGNAPPLLPTHNVHKSPEPKPN